MANTLGIDYAADHLEQEVDRGLEVTIGGLTVAAIVSVPEEMRSYENDGSGYFVSRVLNVTIRIALLTTAPDAGDTLTYDGDTFRIQSVQSDNELGVYMLMCEGLAL